MPGPPPHPGGQPAGLRKRRPRSGSTYRRLWSLCSRSEACPAELGLVLGGITPPSSSQLAGAARPWRCQLDHGSRWSPFPRILPGFYSMLSSAAADADAPCKRSVLIGLLEDS